MMFLSLPRLEIAPLQTQCLWPLNPVVAYRPKSAQITRVNVMIWYVWASSCP
jgi:hypothetical protein